MSWLWRVSPFLEPPYPPADHNQNDASPASFEKALSRLSSQITTANLSLDKSRSRSRRAKALWTLYTTLAYLISALILLLVLGPSELSLPHYSGLLGAPLVIFAIRKAITAIFGWSITRQQSHVDRLQKQRDGKIAELKKATRFDSTQELLSKYGGAPSPTPDKKARNEKVKPDVQRTGLPPPPTANIPGRNASRPQHNTLPQQEISLPNSPQQITAQQISPRDVHLQQRIPTEPPGFAPNAFPEAPPNVSQPHWYDRILDVMLGEDETLAKNRIALVCANPECKLVNGQAPPGTKSLEEVGRWRCQACGSWNGTQSVSEVKKVLGGEISPISPDVGVKDAEEEDEADVVDDGSDESIAANVDEAEEPTGIEKKEKATRRVTRQTAKADD